MTSQGWQQQSDAWARQHAPQVPLEQQKQNLWGRQYAAYIFPEQQQQQQQQPDAGGSQYVPQPSPNIRMNTSLPNSTTYGNNYFYGENYLNGEVYLNGDNYFNVVPQYSYHDGHMAPAMTPTFAPQHIVEQNITAPPCADQGPLTSAQVPHLSDVVSFLTQAMAAMPLHDWHCPNNDATLPTTDQDRQQWVQMLLNAVNNLTDIQSSQGKKSQHSLQKRWVGPLTGPDYYLHVDKLTLCWTIEDLAERLHRIGPSVLHSFDNNFWEQAAKTRKWTFQDRMMRIIELLAVSKTRCDSLLGGKGLQGIVATPSEKIGATKVQAKQNAKRGEILKVGRVIRKQETGRATKRQKTSAHD
ncbi:hypothetical protein G6011_04067 [Alternaria panax]|uniref:Uncharacterized protein n=1 Tax=Alternaria panax TaxID=48097 RepID=A0AAD4NTJ8_9PLEO|nr:hypothetical protein G6011_04067 [Alternaria panax]